jgi:hypothetical protein
VTPAKRCYKKPKNCRALPNPGHDHPDQSVLGLLGLRGSRGNSSASSRLIRRCHPDKLLDHPELLDLNRTGLKGRPLKVQFAMQAEGSGGPAGKLRSGRLSSVCREMLQSCSPSKQADFLQTLL